MTYPNVLVLNYLQTTGQASPEIQMTAESYVAAGYQRLLTFEVDGGGFSLFGDPPAEVFLTAYGLMEFTDMAQVYPVDEAILQRTAEWLFDQQQPDGTWLDQGYSEHWSVQSQAATTAYIAWALIEAGYANTAGVEQAIAYVREAAPQEEDPYSLALIANALTAYDPADSTAQAALSRLHEMRVEDSGVVYWPMGSSPSFMGATGESGSMETTALAAMALMRGNVYPEAVNGALAYLVQGKDAWGTWYTTQATILSLKALLMATERGGQAEGPATVWVSLNGEQEREIAIDEGSLDVVHMVTFDSGFSPTGVNRVQIEVEGGGNLMVQVSTRYYLPWDQVEPAPETEEAITIDIAYDRTTLAVNDEVTVGVNVRLNVEGVVKLALIDLGVPPGFTVLTEDLSRLVEQGVIARYEVTGRQIILYVEDLVYGTPLAFDYRLRARFPMRAQTPPSNAYDYYNPGAPTVVAPLEVTVSD